MTRPIAAFALVAGLVFAPFAGADERAPTFTLGADAERVSLDDLRGKVVYLDFWASWCQPCRASFKWLNEMHERYAARGLVVLAINVDKERKDAESFLARYPASFRVAYDPAGSVADLYNLKGMPSSFLIDEQGGMRVRHVGFREKDKAQLEAEIVALLDGVPREDRAAHRHAH